MGFKVLGNQGLRHDVVGAAFLCIRVSGLRLETKPDSDRIMVLHRVLERIRIFFLLIKVASLM